MNPEDNLIEDPREDGVYFLDPETQEVVDFQSWEELDDPDDDGEEADNSSDWENKDTNPDQGNSEASKEDENVIEGEGEPGGAGEGTKLPEGAEVTEGAELAEGAEAAETAQAAATAATEAEALGAAEAAGGVAAEGAAAAAAPEIGIVALVVIAVVVVLVLIIVIVMAFIGSDPDQASAQENSNCITTDISNIKLGSPVNGYYLLPESPNYDLNVTRAQQWGGKTIIETINVVAALWNQEHPDERMGIGDLNAPGHASHKTGIDADIYSVDSIFMSLPGHTKNNNYKQSLAIELGKLFADTGVIDVIFYDDEAVVSEVNNYINNKGLGGKFSLLDEHDDHFHVRVKSGATPNYTACVEGENPAIIEGDLADLQQKYKEYRKNGYIKTQSIGDPDGDIADGKVKAQTIRTMLQMADFLHSKGQFLELSVVVTGHGPGTLHEAGLAFDIGNESVAKYLMPWAKQNSKDLSLDELIFDNTLIDKGSNYYNLKNGEPFNYSSSTLSGHRNHIHVGVLD